MVPDWIHLPREVEARTLWSFLHDAWIQSITTNALERTAVLSIHIPHLEVRSEQPEGLTMRIQLAEVSSLRAVVKVRWPGPEPPPDEDSFENEQRLSREYRAKGREESITWSEVEASFARDEFLVLQAWIASSQDELTMRIEGLLEEEQWCVLFLRARSLSVVGSEGSLLTVDQLLELGNAYWSRSESAV